MNSYELLATVRKPVPDCPKGVRVAPGELVVVGDAVTTTGAVTTVAISTELYRNAAARMAAITTAIDRECPVEVSGRPITDSRQLVEFGVGAGEGAVQISEVAFLALGKESAA